MFRKTTLAMAMLGAVASTNVMALGLGDIQLKSALNQPLNAEIELLSATGPELQELKVSIAPAQAFAKAGIDRPFFLNKLRFTVGHNATGKPVVHVTSRDVVREPFLDFLLEISWSKGRLVREYTVLVDPPATMPAPAPITETPASRASAPAVQSAPPVSAAPSYTVHNAAQMPPASVSPGQYGPTRRNDTLWSIAERVRPDNGVTVDQMMLGLLRANPEAFVDNNINNLKAGYVLRVPSREDVLAVSRAEALREARSQYAAWRAARNQLSTTSARASAETGTGTAAAQTADGGAVAEPSLQLVAPDSGDAAAAQGGEGLDAMRKDLNMANEALEEQRRKGEEMSARVSTLEKQIANMQRLIQLKDDELARLQALNGDQSGQTAQAPSADAAAQTDMAAQTDETQQTDTTQPAADATTPDAVAPATEGAEGTETATTTAADDTAAQSGQMNADDATAPETAPETAPAAEAAPAAATPDITTATGEPAKPVQQPAPAAAAAPPVPRTATSPGLLDTLLGNPLWLGAGAAVLALLGFVGLRRRRGVETEFQESILQAAHKGRAETDSEIAATAPQSTVSKTPESSLLSEFAVSDVGSIRNDGEADPLAEADVYLAYGRYQQAEDLIKGALEKDSSREDLNLKLLEIFVAARNQGAFDDHAQTLYARLENADDPMWLKVAEMGRELNPANPMYQPGGVPSAAAEPAQSDEPLDDFDFGQADEPEAASDEVAQEDEGLDFGADMSFDVSQSDSLDASGVPEVDMEAQADEPEAVAEDNSLDFDLGDFNVDETAEAAAEEGQGDGELADLDEVSTKLDLARAYIDMGDPDGAKSILDEVLEEGSDNQKEEARDIMAQMS